MIQKVDPVSQSKPKLKNPATYAEARAIDITEAVWNDPSVDICDEKNLLDAIYRRSAEESLVCQQHIQRMLVVTYPKPRTGEIVETHPVEIQPLRLVGPRELPDGVSWFELQRVAKLWAYFVTKSGKSGWAKLQSAFDLRTGTDKEHHPMWGVQYRVLIVLHYKLGLSFSVLASMTLGDISSTSIRVPDNVGGYITLPVEKSLAPDIEDLLFFYPAAVHHRAFPVPVNWGDIHGKLVQMVAERRKRLDYNNSLGGKVE